MYQNFLAINIPADPDLARCSVGTLEETVEKFRVAWENFSALTREKIRADLISRLPKDENGDYGALSVEVSGVFAAFENAAARQRRARFVYGSAGTDEAGMPLPADESRHGGAVSCARSKRV